MMRAATVLWAVLAAAAGTSLFMLKYEVQAQEQRLAGLRKDIVETRESIHVLKAEWSYLNDPSRLREQAERHLGLHPLKPNQIVTIASLPMNDAPKADAPVANGQADPPLAPAATLPAPPPVIRKTPDAPARMAPPEHMTPPVKPQRDMTAAKGQPAAKAKVAAAKPAAGANAVASARPAPPAAPATRAATSNAGNVMVITSPALAEPEVASTRVRP